MVKIVADENMPGVEQLFSPFGDVRLLPGRNLDPRDVEDADVLLVRSVTQVNAALLANSGVKFVGSATIGTDHIDSAYLASRNIQFAHAPGCNAEAVVDYVLATLCQLEENWRHKTLAIVGCGNVGGRLYNRLVQLGVNCLCYDPFLTAQQQQNLCEFGDIFQADILCLHTPLTTDGAYPSWHLFDHRVLRRLKPGALIINAGRGAVIDNSALITAIKAGKVRAALDVWEGEPNINPELLDLVSQGTPHIAGYSLEGRLRGTLMIYHRFCEWLTVEPQIKDLKGLLTLCNIPSTEPLDLSHCQHLLRQGAGDEELQAIIAAAYNPQNDFARLRLINRGEDSLAAGFDSLRKHYPLRREFGFFTIPKMASSGLQGQLRAAGFKRINE
ncbi:MAG: 4-phosphoerythronate dehydrogenase [Porticoccaceae bacterium]|nr:4-phosphoerythronate dehydrogenase [Porticoccaceae bacterium]